MKNTVFFLLIAIICISNLANAKVYNIYPNQTTFATDLASYSLQGGDVVNFHAATPKGSATYDFYNFGGTYSWVGTLTKPITIQGYPGDSITITQSNPNHNILQISGSYFVFQGFEIIGNAAATGSIALRLMPTTSNAVIQKLKVHDLYQNAITANIPGAIYYNITFNSNEIYRTSGTGECFYAGCQSSSNPPECQIYNSVFENNFCHDTCLGGGNTQCSGGSLGSGFQVKMGSYGNIVRNNVCNNTNSPCLLLYDDYNLGQNLIEGNVVLNTAGDSGIQIAAGAVIRNNIVIGSYSSGITITNNPNDLLPGYSNRNLILEHNTFVNNNRYGIEFTATPVNTSVINNAALGNVLGDFSSVSQSGVTWINNAYNTGSIPPGVPQGGAFKAKSTKSELTSPSSYNVYPLSTSSLIYAGGLSNLAYDFNYFGRNACTPTVGAYEYSTSKNPGWKVIAGFKAIDGKVLACTLSNPCPTSCSDPAKRSLDISNTNTNTNTNTTPFFASGSQIAVFVLAICIFIGVIAIFIISLLDYLRRRRSDDYHPLQSVN